MSKRILILSSVSQNFQTLTALLNELTKNGHQFSLKMSGEKNTLASFFQEKHWPQQATYFGPKNNQGFLKSSLFFVCYPVLLAVALFQLGQKKYKTELDLIVCLGWNEKLIYSPVAKLLKIKLLWLDLPGTNYNNKSFLRCYKFFAKWAKIIVFNSLTKTNLVNLKLEPEQIKIIQPGILLNHHNHQENIFNQLAHTEQPQKKFFSVGIVAELDHQQKIESLFQAIKKCLTIVPNIQLIIIGDGRERKNLSWLAKKMEIENLVWFVGEQAYLRKWLESLDLFIVAAEKIKLADLTATLNAMATKLPVIADYSSGVEDLIFENKSGTILQLDDSEELAQEIIRLAQDKRLRHELGEAGKERIEKYFNLSKMVEQFEKII